MRNVSANELPVTAPPEVEREQNSRNHFPLLLFQYQETFHIVKISDCEVIIKDTETNHIL